MKSWKKALALGMCGVMTAGLLAGCESGAGGGGGKKNETVTLTVFSQLANYSGTQTGWSADLFLDPETTGISVPVVLNIIPDQNGAFDTRMESGNLGDIVVLGADESFQRAEQAGLLFDFEQYDMLANHGKYMQEHMGIALEKTRSMSSDGKIHGFGHNISESGSFDAFFYTWDIRWDLYKQLGYPEVNELEDLVQVFKDMKAICPTDEAGNPTYAVYPWPDWDGSMVMYVKSTATSFYGYDEFEIGLYNPTDGSFYGALDDNSPYLRCLKFYNQLYQNDLLCPDSMTTEYTTMAEKVQKGGVFFSIFNYAGSDLFNSEAHLSNNQMMCSLVPKNASPIVYGQSPLGGNRYWCIGANTEYPDVCMEVLNYLCTPEGRMTMEYGPRELCWDYDEDGNTYFTEFGKKAYTDQDGTQMPEPYAGSFHDGMLQINNTTWSIDAFNPESNGERYNWKFWKSEQGTARCETEEDWRSWSGCQSTDEYMVRGNYTVSPSSAYVATQKSDAFKTTWDQVTNTIVTYSWKAIYAKDDAEYEQIVNEMISLAKEYGYDECVEWSVKEAAIRKAAEDEVSQ